MTLVTDPAAPGATGAYTEAAAHRRWRHLKDRAARLMVRVGGVAVLAALLLIFVYLLVEVFPLFQGASVEARASYRIPGDDQPSLFIAAEEQAEVGFRVSSSGEFTFFELGNGGIRRQGQLSAGGAAVSTVVPVAEDRDLLAAGLSDGSVLLFQHRYDVSYPDNKRHIEPSVVYPQGEAALPFMNEAPRALAVRESGDQILFAGADLQGRVHVRSYEVQTSLLGDSTLEVGHDSVFTPSVKPARLLLNPGKEWLYVIDAQGRIALHRLRGAEPPELVGTQDAGSPVLQARFMAGGISLLTSGQDGKIIQWFPARRPQSSAEAGTAWYLARVREFQAPGTSATTALGSELRRRGFAAGTEQGRVALYYSTSQRKLHEWQALDGPIALLAFEPRAQALLALGRDGTLNVFRIKNEHPEVSWSSLWSPVWYESYDQPETLWQSSASSSDFEPKFSLSPLTLGTLKGAFYAMIFAIPLAVLGAIFTAYFMSPKLRQTVKPTVEIMQALPTVVLGFLAGLWLAPFVETYLPGVFLTLILLPLSIPLAAYLWVRAPAAWRYRVPEGWEAVLLVPVLVVVVWFCFLLAQPVEAHLFGGNMQAWMDHELGIGYDQRNCLVVGIAMGVAVIPIIFSIAEDAIFSVPRHLTLGSLALGATPWQTLMGVVLPTASPGIFSAVMIGMGRAVGETMIVLMATGNTPVMDFSMFSGMRTLSANVAVEMPESEVGSTHFRLLFLAGLVLFLFTFLINTVGEVVRQRLREKYGNL